MSGASERANGRASGPVLNVSIPYSIFIRLTVQRQTSIVDVDDGFEGGVDILHLHEAHAGVVLEKLGAQDGRGGGSGGRSPIVSGILKD